MSAIQVVQSDLHRFFARLRPPESQFLEIRAVVPDGAVSQTFVSATQEAIVTANHSSGRANAYVGACPRFEKRGARGSITTVIAAWADLDFHDFDREDRLHAEELIRFRLGQFEMRPTILVATGNGYGPQGSAKTTLLRMLRRLTDPSVTETLTSPKDIAELVQQLSHHWCPYYDNISSFPDWLSDALSRAVTGEGFSKRELYTDDEDVIYSFRRCCGLNGINIAAAKPDLLDRSLLFGLEGIPKSDRRPEKALWRDFERARPILVGALFDSLSTAMGIYPSVRLPELHRMADFMLWGCAIAIALGYSQDEFLEAFEQNFQDRNEEIIANSPVATVIVGFMEGRDRWEGLASELIPELEACAGRFKINTRSRRWPKSANSLGRRLNEIASNLAVKGIQLVHDRTGDKRLIILSREDDPGSDGVGERRATNPDDGPRCPRSESSSISSPETPSNHADYDDPNENDDIPASSTGRTPSPSIRQPTRETPENIVTTVTTVICKEPRTLLNDDTREGALSEQSPRACRACHGTRFWQSVQAALICATCHPADPALVAWVEAESKETSDG